MIRALLIFLLLSAIPLFSYAEEATLCALMVRHEPGLDAAYRPGVDIYGKPVAPADINAPVTPIPDVIKVPVTVDLAALINQNLPAGTKMEAPVALVEIYRDGRVVYNGQDISGDVAALCGIEEGPEPPAAPAQEEEVK